MTNDMLEEFKNYSLSEEGINKIFKGTGEILKFKDYVTGDDIVYYLGKGDEVININCPIDETPLIYGQPSQREGIYNCPNCKNVFDDVTKSGLNLRYNQILNSKKNNLKKSKNKEEKSNLLKIINVIEKK